MSEPIEDGGELDEGEVSKGEFLIASADAAVALEAAKEVFDMVTPTVVAAMKSRGPAARAFWRNTHACALPAKSGAERIRIERFVGHGAAAAQTGQERLDCIQIVALASGQSKRHGAPVTFHNRRQFGVNAALGASDCLRGLPAARIGAGLMQLDMRAVDVAQLAFRVSRHQCEDAREESGGTPAAETRVDRTPRTKPRRQIAPRDPGAQDEEHRRDHEPVIFRWPATAPHCANLPEPRFAARPVNFFSRRHTGSGISARSIAFMRRLRSLRFTLVPPFEDTPYILDNFYTGPKGYFVGLAHAQAGRGEAARVAWEGALALVEQRLRTTPADRSLLLAKGDLLGWLGREEEAMRAARTIEQLIKPDDPWIFTGVCIYAALGRTQEALPIIERQLQFAREHRNLGWHLTPALLRIDPRWDKLRGNPEFEAVLAKANAPEKPRPKS